MNSTTRADDHAETLESRRLLSLTPAGPPVDVPRTAADTISGGLSDNSGEVDGLDDVLGMETVT